MPLLTAQGVPGDRRGLAVVHDVGGVFAGFQAPLAELIGILVEVRINGGPFPGAAILVPARVHLQGPDAQNVPAVVAPAEVSRRRTLERRQSLRFLRRDDVGDRKGQQDERQGEHQFLHDILLNI
ncbi:hypothetical protein C0580_02655 [Candidatus Parcubacteria bacterium]|nr:MAG: hypothetical protein C0580_02655 [Candidatus Parcubacteria bacterium]